MKKEIALPVNYGCIIEVFLPNYYHRDEVLVSDILYRYIEGEEVSDEDMEWLPGSKEEAKQVLEKLDKKLFVESVDAAALQIDWDAYAKDTIEAVRNERIWMLGSNEEQEEMHRDNIERYKEELEHLRNKEYREMFAMYEYDIKVFVAYIKDEYIQRKVLNYC